MGTPEFAVPSLHILIENGYNVVTVITSVDKMGGRGMKQVLQSAVKKYAVQANIPVLQPKNLKAPAFVEELRSYRADLQIVVAFRMLPEVVWNMPPLGTMNLHGSLLPKYRGAAPINWAVIKGETETGVTTFFLKHTIDTGDMLFQKRIPIGPEDTAGDVHDRMMIIGADLVLRSVQAVESRDFVLSPQNSELVTKAPKIFHADCAIDFNQPTETVYNFIRGLSPYPTAWTILDEKQFNIYTCTKEHIEHSHQPGTFIPDGKHLRIATQDGYIQPLQVQLQGRKRMDIKEFLNGYNEFRV